MPKVQRALISCHDKTGLGDFAKALAGLGVELLASGGTATYLQEHGVTVRTVDSFTGASQLLDGRVKTLHPKIHAGILARRDVPAHVQSVGAAGLIDLVVVNLYPFERTVAQPNVALQDAIEQIDIGGVALMRAAAKNFDGVGVVISPQQYASVLEDLREHGGALSDDLRRELAVAAFAQSSSYDRHIMAFLADGPTQDGEPPPFLAIQATPMPLLRYGENPHQPGGWYVPVGAAPAGLETMRQLQGKPLSYNNLLDVDTAVKCLMDFSDTVCVIVKHSSPCGVAMGATAQDAYRRAYEADAESAFGGIVGLNRTLDGPTAAEMVTRFVEVVVAPTIDDTARAAFQKRPNVRLIELPAWPKRSTEPEWRSILGGWLVQRPDQVGLDAKTARVVTKRQPTQAERRDLEFAWLIAKHVRSNAIVLAKDGMTIAIGQGQPSRVRAVRFAIQNAGDRARGAVLASDGFFPFPDNVEFAAKAGVTALIEPGGSVKDPDVIAAADAAGLAMVFTGIRHFRH